MKRIPKQKKGLDQYSGNNMDTPEQFASYLNQVQLVTKYTKLKGQVLEIGKGLGFLEFYLEKLQYEVITIDYDKSLNPDMLIDITKGVGLVPKSFDTICAFEVFEHMPYVTYLKVLEELKEVTRNKIIISLPVCSVNGYITCKLRKMKFYKSINIPAFWRTDQNKNLYQHHWEIGIYSYMISKIRKDFNSLDLVIEQEGYVEGNPYHKYFVLSKKKKLNGE